MHGWEQMGGYAYYSCMVFLGFAETIGVGIVQSLSFQYFVLEIRYHKNLTKLTRVTLGTRGFSRVRWEFSAVAL